MSIVPVNYAQGKPVILQGVFGLGSFYFPGHPPPLPPAAIVTDGIHQAGAWTKGVWWDEQYIPIHNYVLVDLQASFTINAIDITVDANDTYILSYRDPAGNWLPAWLFPALPGWGLVERSVVLPGTIDATALRLEALAYSDFAFSVSEIQVGLV